MSTTTKAQATLKKTNVTIMDIEENDVFSEQSHYVFKGRNPSTGRFQFMHMESGNVVNLDQKYVENLLQTADQFHTEVEVGIEDKLWTAKQIEDARKGGDFGGPKDEPRVGDLRQKGILTIWDEIHSQQVFTVNFNKVAKEMSNKAATEARDAQLQKALSTIAAAAKAKKGVATAAAQAIREIQDNPIQTLTKGEERELRGYKTEFSSINGLYTVIDMDIEADPTQKGSAKRQVNVRGINFLVFNGVKYIVK